jgi:parvulin-like peptidyl-prolyl isomerase
VAIVGVICLGVGFSSGKEVGRKLPATSKNYSSSKVMATVGDVKITGADLAKKMEPVFYLNGKEVMSDEQIAYYESSMLEYMTTTEALYLEATTENIEVTDDEVQQEYDTYIESLESSFNMTAEEYMKTFKTSEEELKEELRKELIAVKYIAQASEVSDEEAQNYYDNNKDEFLQIRASHILIQTNDEEGNELTEEENAKNKETIQSVLDRINAGEDFSMLAKEYSEDITAQNGGDLDFFSKGQMVSEFEDAAFSLSVGEVYSEIVETAYGYHIIKKTDEQYDDFEDIKEELKYNLSYEKQNNLITNLLEKYNVDIKE